MSAPAHPELEGRWQPLRAELDGAHAPAEALSPMEVELRSGRYVVRYGGQVADEGTFLSAAGALALELTLTGTAGPNTGREIPCIFQLAGARLRICYGFDGNRPETFAAPAGSGRYLVTYRRLG